MENEFKLRPVKLVLGNKYMVTYDGSRTIHVCKLIKVTPKGYNFLPEDKDKCLFDKGVYISNCSNHKDGTWFWLPDYVKVSEFRSNEVVPVIPVVSNIETYNHYKERKVKSKEFYSWTDYNKTVLN